MTGDHVDTVTHLISGSCICSRTELAMTHDQTCRTRNILKVAHLQPLLVPGRARVRGVGWYFYHLRLRLRTTGLTVLAPLLFFSPSLPDQRLFMVFISIGDLGGDFRLISRLLSLRLLLFWSSVLQLQNIKLSFKCCPYIRSSYSCSKNLKCVVSTHVFQQSSCC